MIYKSLLLMAVLFSSSALEGSNANAPSAITGACPRNSIKVRVQPSGNAKSYETCSSITDSKNQCYYSRLGLKKGDTPEVPSEVRCISGQSPMFYSPITSSSNN
ncbi:MAG: hypothetical protein KA715_14080 [Xanthomonadaceae bacterium]|nr:hypothetical protein [Xanthomonadaceae bacterium]